MYFFFVFTSYRVLNSLLVCDYHVLFTIQTKFELVSVASGKLKYCIVRKIVFIKCSFVNLAVGSRVCPVLSDTSVGKSLKRESTSGDPLSCPVWLAVFEITFVKQPVREEKQTLSVFLVVCKSAFVSPPFLVDHFTLSV